MWSIQRILVPIDFDDASELALDFESMELPPQVKRHEAAIPRLGVWVPWADTDSIGWIRYTLDQEKIPYTYLRDEEIRSGNLKKIVDVIVYGNVLMDLPGQIHGIERKDGAMPFRKSPATPHLGSPVESDDITGGIGWNGLQNLQQFVDEGGVFITLGRGSTLVLESGFVRNVRRADVSHVSTPGAELRVKFTRPDHPIAYGYPTITSAFRSNYRIYDPPKRWLTMAYCTSCLDGPYDMNPVILQWGVRAFQDETKQQAEPIIASGGGRNAEELEGRPAILDTPLGKGHVIVFNFNPMHRDLNHSDYRFLWNAILNWTAL